MSNINSTLATADAPANAWGQEPLAFVTLENLRAVIQDSGYRAEIVTDGTISFLRSASNGLDFDLRPGNVLANASGTVGEGPQRFADFVFVVLFAVQGAFPVDVLNRWNQTHRFARLFLDKTNPEKEFLAMTLDVSVAGGVTRVYLRHQLAIWDSLVQQLVPWLREELGKIASTVNTQKTASSDQVQQIQPANM